MGREPGKNVRREEESSNLLHFVAASRSAPPQSFPIAPLYQKLVIFEANYSRLLFVTETRLRHLLRVLQQSSSCDG